MYFFVVGSYVYKLVLSELLLSVICAVLRKEIYKINTDFNDLNDQGKYNKLDNKSCKKMTVMFNFLIFIDNVNRILVSQLGTKTTYIGI